MRAQHQLANTVIIFLSDNGQTFGDHRWRYKRVPYERSIWVPFAIRYDRLDGGSAIDRHDRVMSADVFATVMDLTLGPSWVAPTPVDGLSLRRAIAGTQATRRHRAVEAPLGCLYRRAALRHAALHLVPRAAPARRCDHGTRFHDDRSTVPRTGGLRDEGEPYSVGRTRSRNSSSLPRPSVGHSTTR